jgi:hypothetical protein
VNGRAMHLEPMAKVGITGHMYELMPLCSLHIQDVASYPIFTNRQNVKQAGFPSTPVLRIEESSGR